MPGLPVEKKKVRRPAIWRTRCDAPAQGHGDRAPAHEGEWFFYELLRKQMSNSHREARSAVAIAALLH